MWLSTTFQDNRSTHGALCGLSTSTLKVLLCWFCLFGTHSLYGEALQSDFDLRGLEKIQSAKLKVDFAVVVGKDPTWSVDGRFLLFQVSNDFIKERRHRLQLYLYDLINDKSTNLFEVPMSALLEPRFIGPENWLVYTIIRGDKRTAVIFNCKDFSKKEIENSSHSRPGGKQSGKFLLWKHNAPGQVINIYDVFSGETFTLTNSSSLLYDRNNFAWIDERILCSLSWVNSSLNLVSIDIYTDKIGRMVKIPGNPTDRDKFYLSPSAGKIIVQKNRYTGKKIKERLKSKKGSIGTKELSFEGTVLELYDIQKQTKIDLGEFKYININWSPMGNYFLLYDSASMRVFSKEGKVLPIYIKMREGFWMERVCFRNDEKKLAVFYKQRGRNDPKEIRLAIFNIQGVQ